MQLISVIFGCLVVLLNLNNQYEASKKSSQRNDYYTYYKYYYYFKQPYHYKPRNWPKVRGRCDVVADFKINGTNPIKEEAAKGRVVLLYLMKRTCLSCYAQLATLNDYAAYYRKVNMPISIIALNHRKQPLPDTVLKKFPLVKFYDEPVDQNIFGKLKSKWRSTMVFDICGRQQYKFGYPYSLLSYPFTRSGVMNTLNHHVSLCGKCNATLTTTPKETRPPTQVPRETRPKTTETPMELFLANNRLTRV